MNYKFDEENTIMSEDKSFISKYKPQKLEDTFYNHHFKDVINSLINMNCLNVLLKGDVCSGKTTLTECIVNKYYQDVNKDDIYGDIYVFTCLNEQGINGFRRILKEFCQTKGNIQGRKKTIILDDIDTLTEQNQQIIRSNIDKYSSSINFISTCTNLNKVIDTLQSRFNILKIPQITNKEIETVYDKICMRENIELCNESKMFVMTMCDYSINVLMNNLEKIKLYMDDEMTIDDIKQICCQISHNYYDKYYTCIINQKKKQAFEVFHTLYETGYSFIDILENFVGYIKYTQLVDINQKYTILKIICKYINILYTISDEYLEMMFFTNHIYKIVHDI